MMWVILSVAISAVTPTIITILSMFIFDMAVAARFSSRGVSRPS